MSARSENKKQQRTKKVRQKLQKQREAHTRERQEQNREVHLNRMFRHRPVPIRNGGDDPEVERLAHDIEIKTKLQHNMEILKALEAQIEREESERMGTNQRLEEDGHLTLKEKVEALQQEAADAGMTGTAEVMFTPNAEDE